LIPDILQFRIKSVTAKLQILRMINVGCCGYPAATKKYYDRFNLVEINRTFHKFPKITTVKKWREEAPKGARADITKAFKSLIESSS
jgi:hypothetical protein